PELPEVEYGRKVAAAVAEGRTISAAVAARDEIVFCGRPAQEIVRALTGARVESVARKGKYIWFALDRRPWPIFHFGLTGAFRVSQDTPLKLASHGRDVDASWPPRFAKIELRFDDGGQLVMTNARRLGRIRLSQDPLGEAPLCDLGFDPLLEMPGLA